MRRSGTMIQMPLHMYCIWIHGIEREREGGRERKTRRKKEKIIQVKTIILNYDSLRQMKPRERERENTAHDMKIIR